MIVFVLTRGRQYTLKAVRDASTGLKVRLLGYDELIRAKRLPQATYVFTDIDRLSYFDQELAGLIYQQLKRAGARVLNDPGLVRKRPALLQALHAAGLNDFRAYPAEVLPMEMRFPVFIRKIQGHGLPCSDLLHQREDLDAKLRLERERGTPLENLLVIEYAGEPVQPGLYRKLAYFRVGSTFTQYLCGHDTTWLVKTGQKGIATEELYQDEARMVRENPYADYFKRVFDLARIEYGRADFGFSQGRPQVFEINTNPSIGARANHPSAIRLATIGVTWKNLIESFAEIDSKAGPEIRLPRDPLLNRHRKWWSFLVRSRLVD